MVDDAIVASISSGVCDHSYALWGLTLAKVHSELPRARPERVLGQDVDATRPGADPVHSLINEQIDMITRNQLVRMSCPVQLLRGVCAQRETRTMILLVGPRRDGQSRPSGVRDHQFAQFAAVSGLLRSGVTDIQAIDVSRETADPDCPASVGIRLIRPCTEPALMSQSGSAVSRLTSMA